MKKFKVITRITQYISAESREDAEKFQESLIRQGKLSLEKDGKTVVLMSRSSDVNYLQAPEDISKTRDPIEQPRTLDWIEISQDGMSMIALVTKLSKRRVYYFEALTRSYRSMEKDAWRKWVENHTIHPSYEHSIPPFIISEAIREHEERGLLAGMSSSPDSGIILKVLEKYGYEPTDYELQNGYWAENEMTRAISQHILDNSSDVDAPNDGLGTIDDFDIAISDDLPTIDEVSF